MVAVEDVFKPECYKKPIQYSADACGSCRFSMICYKTFLNYMNQNKQGLWG